MRVVDIVKPRSFFVEAHIADIHFGVIDPETTYYILLKQFVEPLAQMKVLDIISINGDLFHHKFMANSNAVMYAMYFIQDLVNICRSKDATLLLISGTGSHDADQMRLFYPLMKLDDVDVRVIMDIKFEYVKGKKILCIPELYNKGENYYKPFLDSTYDSCYMHGNFKGAIYGKNEVDLDGNREPTFDINSFGGCLGPIISGHNHIYGSYANNEFFYCGSPIRWSFGEEQPKGWLLLFHNIVDRWYKVHFEPIVSFRYETIRLDEIMKSDPNTIIQYINQIKNSGIDYLRVKFSIQDKDKISLLRSYYNNRRDIIIDLEQLNPMIDNKLNEIEEEQNQMISSFLDPNLSPEEKLVIYMNNQEGNSYWTVDLFKEFMEQIKKI